MTDTGNVLPRPDQLLAMIAFRRRPWDRTTPGTQLVTCGGVFDHQTGSYLSNIVVYTSLVKVIPAAVPATAASAKV
jgi:hypothetical protein